MAGLADGEVQPAVLDGLVARLEQILAEDQQVWLRLRSTEPQPLIPGQDAGSPVREPWHEALAPTLTLSGA